MTWIIVAVLLAAGGAVYAFAKQRGEQKKAKEVIDRESELDREEADNELADKRNNNAWDNLNDTLDDMGKR
jgi:Flp pilus assembly protein TadB